VVLDDFELLAGLAYLAGNAESGLANPRAARTTAIKPIAPHFNTIRLLVSDSTSGTAMPRNDISQASLHGRVIRPFPVPKTVSQTVVPEN
jgi:hypothetical protein